MQATIGDLPRPLSTPRARRRAALENIDLSQVRGSGLGGRILDEDVKRAVIKPTISAMRRTIAERTAESFRTIPHFYLETEIDATGLVEFRRHYRERSRPSIEWDLSFTDLFLRGLSIALQSCPEANALWEGETIQRVMGGGVGLVVSVPSGLYVPILSAPYLHDLDKLAAERFRLVRSARTGQLEAKMSVKGPGAPLCVTSLSNLGSGRIDRFLPVIHVGQSSMLAVGRIANRPWVKGEGLTVKPTLNLTLAADHRVMDGVAAAGFLDKVCQYLESPYE